VANEAKDKSIGPRPKFKIVIRGPKVGEARMSASDMVEIISRTQQALKRIGQVLYGEDSKGKGRKKREIEELCELFITAWEPGSAIACLELGEPPAQMEMFGHIGEESIKLFLKGVQKFGKGKTESLPLPEGFDKGVIEAFDRLGKVFEHGIEEINFFSQNGNISAKAIYNKNIRASLRSILEMPHNIGGITKVGRLERLDGHKRLSGTLWEPDGSKWTCWFKDEHLELLHDAWLKVVKVAGSIKENTIEVDSLVITDAEFSGGEDVRGSLSFWESSSLEELAERQGIDPVEDLDELSALWPEEHDPDAFLEYILKERSDRRRIVAGER